MKSGYGCQLIGRSTAITDYYTGHSVLTSFFWKSDQNFKKNEISKASVFQEHLFNLESVGFICSFFYL